MVDEIVKTRFAPSPSGELHLGNLRTALFNVLLARKTGGVFLLRIEDTDPGRSRPEYARALEGDLRWLGLEWQEGPGMDGDAGPYRQSQRTEIYRHYYGRLEERGLVYPCFCSGEKLKAQRRRLRAAGRPPRYAGTCAQLSAAEVRRREAAGMIPALRFRVPPDDFLTFEDMVRGAQGFRTHDIGDFIIRRADGTPAFFFSNAIDDALMGVTHVLRGEDHLTNTPRQLMLMRALDLRAPRYGHIALIVGPDGSPLSKRHGSRSLRELREQGYLADALINYLARLGHRYAREELQSLDELAAGFEIANLGRAPARYDESQLRYWQREAIVHTSDEALWEWLKRAPGGLAATVPEERAGAFVRTVRDNMEFPSDAAAWSDRFFAAAGGLDEGAATVIREAGADFFAAAIACLETAGDEFASYARALAHATGVRGKSLFLPLRVALTGVTHGPEMARLWRLLGTATIRARLEAARAACQPASGKSHDQAI
jgi:nondiscriminating glutamyl-tRNA synthetase